MHLYLLLCNCLLVAKLMVTTAIWPFTVNAKQSWSFSFSKICTSLTCFLFYQMIYVVKKYIFFKKRKHNEKYSNFSVAESISLWVNSSTPSLYSCLYLTFCALYNLCIYCVLYMLHNFIYYDYTIICSIYVIYIFSLFLDLCTVPFLTYL